MVDRTRPQNLVRISNQELEIALVGETKTFPKYTTQLLNLSNQNAQATRPAIVGQMTELIKECPSKSFSDWKEWYIAKKPKAIADSTAKIKHMVENLRQAMTLLDEALISAWVVEDLVLVKTFVGLKFQEAILKRIAESRRTSYRLATPHEESKGIDGYIGEMQVSIKPDTYKLKASLPEAITIPIIYYAKTKEGIEIDTTSIEEQGLL